MKNNNIVPDMSNMILIPSTVKKAAIGPEEFLDRPRKKGPQDPAWDNFHDMEAGEIEDLRSPREMGLNDEDVDAIVDSEEAGLGGQDVEEFYDKILGHHNFEFDPGEFPKPLSMMSEFHRSGEMSDEMLYQFHQIVSDVGNSWESLDKYFHKPGFDEGYHYRGFTSE
jgi:hypothetical protein